MSSNSIHKKQKLSSGFWFTLGIGLLCVIALALTLVLVYRNTNDLKIGKNDGALVNLTNQSLVSNSGWNNDIVSKLNELSNAYGDNVALGNSNGVKGVLISLGGYDWQVVYRENGVLTLFMVDSIKVADIETTTTNYRASKVRDYLNNVFYPQFLQNIGFDDFDNYVIPSGDLRLSYQLQGMQNIDIRIVGGAQIVNNDITVSDKVWIPSAYEVGGYRIGEGASTSRVNSFNRDVVNGKNIASGLWNLSANYRASENAYLRSSTDEGKFLCLDSNGLIIASDSNKNFEIRPAINLVVPQSLNSSLNMISNQSKTSVSGAGTSQSPYVISTALDLVEFSNNVLNGDSYAGKYVVLNSNIDLSGITVWKPIGLYNNGVNAKPFSGNFDGQGFVVSHASSANTGLVGLFGYLNNAVVSNVAVTATNWSTANDCAGGIAAVMENSSTLSVCYNNSSISAKNKVGGVVGCVNPTSTNACTINNVYNTGAVAGKNSVAGIVGEATRLTLNCCYNIGSVNKDKDIIDTSSNVTVNNAYYTAKDAEAIGTKLQSLETMRNKNSYPGFDFYSDLNTTGVWFKSSILNDGFPTLKIFVKTVGIKLFSNNAQAGDYYAQLQGSATKYKSTSASLGTSVTFTAEVANGYRFLGWYVAVIGVNGSAVINSDEATLFNANATFNQTLTDYLYLEARFVKTYTVTVSSLFSDFSTSYQNANAVSVTNNGTKVGNMYDAGSVITITVSKNISELNYVGLGYKTTASASTYSSLGNDLDNTYGYWRIVSNNANNVVYELIAGNPAAFTTNEFHIQVQFERQFSLSLSVTTDGVEKFPSASVQFGTNGTTLTASTTPQSAAFDYNVAGGLILSVDLTNSMSNGAPLYALDDWTFSYGENSSTLNAETTSFLVSTYIPSNVAANDSIYELTLVANFSLNTFEISASAVFQGTRETLDSSSAELSKIYLKLDSGASVQSIQSNVTSLVVAQRSVVGICFVPNVAYGYKLNQLLVDGTAQTPTLNQYGVYYFDYTMQPKNVQVVIRIDYLPITFSASVCSHNGSNYDSIASGVTLSPSSYASPNYYTSISGLQVNVTTTNNLNMCYELESVDATFDGGTTYTTIATYNNQSGQSSYTLFQQNTAISFVYQQCSQQLSSSNATVSLRVVLAPISQTLTLIAYYKGTSDVVNSSLYQLTLSAINQISSDTSTNVYGYVRGTSVTITTNSLNLGHRVLGYGTQANQSSGFSGTATTGYQNSATFTFTIEQNLTMYIYFELRDFTVAFESNANTITGGNAPFASQGITARETTSSQSINLPFDANSTSTSTIHLSYGQSLAFMATNTPVNSTQLNSKNLRLVSVTIKDASNDTQIKQLYSSNQNSAVMTDEEIISMVEDGNSITDSIRIVFRYNFTQIVRIKFASSVTNTDPLAGATIQFNNEDIQGYNLGVQLTPEVINTIKTNLNGYEVTLTADEDGTNYNIIFLMKIDYVVTDSTTNVTSTQFVLSLDGGSPITFEISQITYNNNAVNITGYFVFSN